MRDAIVHLSWLLSHVARTLWSDHQTKSVVAALGEEVRGPPSRVASNAPHPGGIQFDC